MIAFDLECSQGHPFEGWFDNMHSFEDQNVKKMISCPYCNDTDIRKVLSPVAMKSSSTSVAEKEEVAIDYHRLAIEAMEYINKNFEELGTDFTKEALNFVSNIDSRIILIDGPTLAKYMIEHNVGVSIQANYEIKKIDQDYFIDD